MSRRLIALICLLAPIAEPALAHAILMASTPAAGGSASPGPLAIRLHYNSLVDAKRSRLTLIGPDGREHRLAIGSDAAGDTVTASATVAPGRNVLRWQVLAVDGHITRGDVNFDAAPAAR